MKDAKINFDEAVENCKTMDDLVGKNGLIQRLLGGAIEAMLEAEMEDHLGYKEACT